MYTFPELPYLYPRGDKLLTKWNHSIKENQSAHWARVAASLSQGVVTQSHIALRWPTKFKSEKSFHFIFEIQYFKFLKQGSRTKDTRLWMYSELQMPAKNGVTVKNFFITIYKSHLSGGHHNWSDSSLHNMSCDYIQQTEQAMESNWCKFTIKSLTLKLKLWGWIFSLNGVSLDELNLCRFCSIFINYRQKVEKFFFQLLGTITSTTYQNYTIITYIHIIIRKTDRLWSLIVWQQSCLSNSGFPTLCLKSWHWHVLSDAMWLLNQLDITQAQHGGWRLCNWHI